MKNATYAKYKQAGTTMSREVTMKYKRAGGLSPATKKTVARALGKLGLQTVGSQATMMERLGKLTFDELRALCAAYDCELSQLDQKMYANLIAGKSR